MPTASLHCTQIPLPSYTFSIFFFHIPLPKALLWSESGKEHHEVKEAEPYYFFSTPASFCYSLLPVVSSQSGQ